MGNLATPKSVQKLQTALHAKAKAEAGYRFYALYDKISRDDILAHAYAQCRSNKGAPGIDGPLDGTEGVSADQAVFRGITAAATSKGLWLREYRGLPQRCGAAPCQRAGEDDQEVGEGRLRSARRRRGRTLAGAAHPPPRGVLDDTKCNANMTAGQPLAVSHWPQRREIGSKTINRMRGKCLTEICLPIARDLRGSRAGDAEPGGLPRFPSSARSGRPEVLIARSPDARVRLVEHPRFSWGPAPLSGSRHPTCSRPRWHPHTALATNPNPACRFPRWPSIRLCRHRALGSKRC